MTTDTITISAGRPNRQGTEQDFAGPDGTYQVTLSSVSDPIEEASRQPRVMRNGKPDPRDDGKWIYRVWTIAIEGGEYDDQVLDIRANTRSTGPHSKQFELVSAFLGRAPQAGDQVALTQLLGRSALALILTNENDYPYVKQIMPLARTARPAEAAPPLQTVRPAVAPPVQEPVPTQPTTQPQTRQSIRQQVDGPLPF